MFYTQASKGMSAVKSIGAELVYLGYGRHGAAMNMAIDEAMMRHAEKERKFFIRFYDFSRPTVVLATSDSAKNIKNTDAGIEFTRRVSAGKPIYIDDNVLSYSITGPAGHEQVKDPVVTHYYLGSATAEALEATIGSGHRIELGSAPTGKIPYSIRAAGGEPIAGHGQFGHKGPSFLYHGVIAVGKWDAEAINSAINLKEDHYRRIKALPYVSGLAGNVRSVAEHKRVLMQNMRDAFRRRFAAVSEANAEELSAMLAYARKALVEGHGMGREHGYESNEWLFRKDIALKEDSSFCLLYEG